MSTRTLAADPSPKPGLPAGTRILLTFGAVGLLHLAAAVLLATSFVEGATPLALSLVAAAYLAGIKHSYDWDHIAAIDNSTRRFVAQGKSPVSVGFAFSLGHSTVVTLTGLLVVAGAGFAGGLLREGAVENTILGMVGSAVSGLFLLLMGLFNATAFLQTGRLYRRVRQGAPVELEELEAKGLVARLLNKPLAGIRSPRHIYVIGFLFGLGFDTATTIALLLLTASASLAGVPALALMSLPLCFTAAMTLCDTGNGLAVLRMYRAALTDPARKIGFNMTITGVSALSALFISVITLGSLGHEILGLDDPVTSWLGNVDLADAGLLLVAGLLVIWGAAAACWWRRHPRPARTR